MPRQTVNESTDANTFNKAAAPHVVTKLYAAPQPAPESIRSILIRCREFIDTTKVPAYPAGADLADEIDVLLAAQPAPAPLSDEVVQDAARYRWLFGARTDAQAMSVSETVFKPLPQDEVLSHLQGFYMSKADVDALVDAARKEGGAT